jgi:hypothetical protein
MAAPGIYAAGRFWINRIAGIFLSAGVWRSKTAKNDFIYRVEMIQPVWVVVAGYRLNHTGFNEQAIPATPVSAATQRRLIDEVQTCGRHPGIP